MDLLQIANEQYMATRRIIQRPLFLFFISPVILIEFDFLVIEYQIKSIAWRSWFVWR